MRIRKSESILLVIDLQDRLLPAVEGGEAVLASTATLVDVAHLVEVPVVATEQYPRGLGPTVPALRERLAQDPIVDKLDFSALSDGRLLALPQSARRQWIVAGAETHVCVQQTVFDLLEAGRQVFVVDDAVGSRRPRDKELALQRMQRNGAEIVTREMVLFEWLERAGTPLFKEISKQFIR